MNIYKMKHLKLYEDYNDSAVVLYHGTSKVNEIELLKNGWEPNKISSGSQQGDSRYLYLATTPENSCYYSAMKGNDKNVLEVTVPMNYLRVDPHDGIYNSVEEEIEKGTSLILIKPLNSSHFKKYTGSFSVTGCDFDD